LSRGGNRSRKPVNQESRAPFDSIETEKALVHRMKHLPSL
jgi:hypothetical protein